MDSHHDDESSEQTSATGPSLNTAVRASFSGMVFWAVGACAFAIAAWHDGVSGFFHTTTPIVYALGSITFAIQFWLFMTNWRGRAKRDWEKPRWGNRHPTEYVRPQSRFLQAAARIGVPLIILSDLLVIGFALVR